MIGLSIKEFINTLKNIIFSSPSSILFAVAGFIFLIAMVTNVRKKGSIGKTLYLIGWIFIVTFLVTKYNGYLTTLLDNLINNVFMQVFFPNLATYVIIIILSNIIYIKSALKKDKKNYEKIINTIFFVIIMFGMNYTLEEVISDNVNIYDVDLYSNQKILVLVQSTTIVFIVWQVFLISKKIITKLISLSNNKVEKDTLLNKSEITNKDNLEVSDADDTIQDGLQTIVQTPEVNPYISQKESVANDDSVVQNPLVQGVNISYVNPMSNVSSNLNTANGNIQNGQFQNVNLNLNNALTSSNVSNPNLATNLNNVVSSEQKNGTQNLQTQNVISKPNNGGLNIQSTSIQNNAWIPNNNSNSQVVSKPSDTIPSPDIFNQIPK